MRNIIFVIVFIMVLAPDALFGQYKVMFSRDYPPYNFINEDGELVGFNVDILQAIKDLYQSDIEIGAGEWFLINQELKQGEIHAIAGTHYSGGPDRDYDYTRSTINTSHCFLYNGNFNVSFSLEKFRSLKEPLVAMWNNDVLKHYVTSINPSSRFLFVSDYSQLVEALERKDVSCIFGQKVASKYYAEQMGRDYVLSLNHQILERNMGFKVSKDVPELAQLLNNGLEVILANGEYQKIYDRWITKYSQDNADRRIYFKYIYATAIVTMSLFLLLFVINQILKSRIRSKTKDLQHQLELNSEIMKELEKQKEKAEESDKMKSAFLANMSHEIRTPMNGILGFTELLKSVDYSLEEQSGFIRIIEQSGNRMLGTINNIIDVSKLESGLEKPQYGAVNIKEILKQLEAFFLPETEAKGIKLLLKEQGAIYEDSFFTDEYKLNSILTNLIKNAIKFTSEGYVEVKYGISQEFSEIWITDTGIGISDTKQNSIFDQFVQADISYSSGYEGSGLGLSITKGYVKLLNGEISLESLPQKGTTFYVRIPNNMSPV